MSSPHAVQFQLHCRNVDWQELEALFRRAALEGREGDKLRRAFEQSTVCCMGMDGPRLVAAARALSDGEYHATIYDVVVDPDYQRQAVGSRLLRELLLRLPVWRILLVADADVQPFYRSLGFLPYANVMALIDRERLFERP